MQRKAAQRDEELRAHWRDEVLPGYRSDQLIFIDESASNEYTVLRKFGWSPKGKRACVTVPLVRSKRWSVLPAYSSEGFLTWDTFQGSYDTNLFNTFVESQLLPICNRFPEPRSVIVMDNASIHRSPVPPDSF
jgi:hypothetical protein